MASAFLLQGAASFLSLALGLLLPRWLPEKDLSQYLLASTVIQTGALLAMLGTRQTIERSFGLLRRESEKKAGVFLASMVTGRLLTTGLAALTAAGLALSFQSAGLSPSLWGWLVGLVVVRSLSELPFHVRLSLGETNAGAWPQTLRYGVRFPAVVVGYRLGGLVGVFVSTLTAELGLACYGWKKVRSDWRWDWRGLWPAEMGEHWAFARTVALYSVLVIGINQVGPWVSGWLPCTQAGRIDFNMAWQLGLQFLQLHYVAQQAAIPRLSSVLAQGGRPKFLAAIDGQVRATWALCSTLVGCVALGVTPLVHVTFGSSRRGLAMPLTISFVAVSAWAMGSVFSHGLFSAGHPRPAAAIHGAVLGVAGILFLTLAPTYGIGALPWLYSAACLFGWVLACQTYRVAMDCPLSNPTFLRLGLSAITGLAAFYLSRPMETAQGLPLFLILHGAGLASTGLLWDSQRMPLKRWLFVT